MSSPFPDPVMPPEPGSPPPPKASLHDRCEAWAVRYVSEDATRIRAVLAYLKTAHRPAEGTVRG